MSNTSPRKQQRQSVPGIFRIQAPPTHHTHTHTHKHKRARAPIPGLHEVQALPVRWSSQARHLTPPVVATHWLLRQWLLHASRVNDMLVSALTS